MQIIVTGSTGFIGSAFVRHLTERGIDVIALGRRPLQEVEPAKRAMLAEASYIPVKMSEIATLPDRLAESGISIQPGCVFFNLAWGGAGRLSDLDVDAQMANVTWSHTALTVARKIGCGRFIQVGTMEEAFTYKYLNLDWHSHAEYNRHVIYSVAKISAKYTLTLEASMQDMEFIYVLHSHVMGPNDDKDSFLQVLLGKLISREPLILSSGEQMFDVVSLNDCVLGYRLLCERGIPGKNYWVGSGDPRPLREYVERMYRLYPSGQEMQFGRLPYNDIKLSAEDFSIGELQRDTGYAPTMTFEDTVELLRRHLYPNHRVGDK